MKAVYIALFQEDYGSPHTILGVRRTLQEAQQLVHERYREIVPPGEEEDFLYETEKDGDQVTRFLSEDNGEGAWVEEHLLDPPGPSEAASNLMY